MPLISSVIILVTSIALSFYAIITHVEKTKSEMIALRKNKKKKESHQSARKKFRNKKARKLTVKHI
ncbi:hypothetical protein [Serratia rubidaea]|uniref:hypothetical protein n=1 Tax=Serratia rubidaea TaxID=61652 RepID=UPI0022B887D7|nr:hypothetical protein [Serratia rubidaea]WBF44427.1 hypothetical protein OLD77_17540 [Serratia rubidaea]